MIKQRFYRVLTPIFILSAVSSCGSSLNNPVSPAPGSASPNAAIVHIPMGAQNLGSRAYGQNPLTISPGASVTWINDDSVNHSATSDTGAFDTGMIAPGQSSSFTFSTGTSGTFPYHDVTFPSMTGTIIVGSPSPPVASPVPVVTPAPVPIPCNNNDLDQDGDGCFDTDGDGR